MMLFLSKFLPIIIYPLGLAWLVLMGVLLFGKLKRAPKVSIIIVLVLIFLSSNRWTASILTYRLEREYIPSGELPQAEAIVLLGGGTEPQMAPRQTVELNGAGDRVFYAAYLYHQDKAPYILASGGRLPWDADQQSTPADEMRILLQALGVPGDAVWLESESRNTDENASLSKAILDAHNIKNILLVTSAIHMPRSVYLFEQQGFTVIPAPTDFNITDAGWNLLFHPDIEAILLGIFPQSGYLNMTTTALKEYIGRAVAQITHP